MKPRQIISDNEIIVVLDTSTVRNLAFVSEPPSWVTTFAKMSRDGYSFSLADAAAAELLNQVRSNRTIISKHKQSIEWVSTFLNPEIRVLPGGIDVQRMIDSTDIRHAEETRHLADIAWEMLLHPLEEDVEDRRPFDELLDEDRDEWMSYLADTDEHLYMFGLDVRRSDPTLVKDYLIDLLAGAIDKGESIFPPFSTRRHLEIRYRVRQYVRTTLTKKPYNPASKKNRNDGIDLTLYDYLMLPALVLANDSGFYSSLNDIDSFQKSWFMTPEKLASEWLEGKRPHPKWPECSVDEEDEDLQGVNF
ncbi:hypothetical protein LZ683_09150 [Comamonas testosteroni]|uniref:hypothetical protein n=1 Tax=Comamonas testosteroni TaxID=285 RepID=UPI0023AB02E6|nr:hypothetical protein [Comamonas testosteroni]WEE79507.1 hypothetical protein LZ683_09150 [Comamonas testosteroni]